MRSSIIKKYNIAFSTETDDKTSLSSSPKGASKKSNSKRKNNDTNMER
jgi:hypothetical protein